MKRYIVWSIVLIVVVGSIYAIFLITTPWRIMYSFIRAVEKEDAAKVVFYATPEERKYCGVTEQSVKIILENTLGKWRPFKAVKIGKVPWRRVPLYKKLGWHKWFVIWGNAVSGEPIPNSSGHRHHYPEYGIDDPHLITEISVCPTKEGWKVLVTQFLIQLTFGVYDYKCLAVLRQAGIKGEVDIFTKPGDFKPFPKP